MYTIRRTLVCLNLIINPYAYNYSAYHKLRVHI